MGRININFHVTHAATLAAPHINPDAIPARDLAMVLLNLPGKTHITGCFTGIKSANSLMTENTIEATNDALPDGTSVTVNYSRLITMNNGIASQHDHYNGMYIDQPFATSSNASLPQGNVQPPQPSAGVCNYHSWKVYHGLNSSDEFCTVCGIKK